MKMKFISILSEWVIAVAMSSFIFILLIKESELNYFISGNEWSEWRGKKCSKFNCSSSFHQLPKIKFNYEWRGANAGAEWLIKLIWDSAARRGIHFILLMEWLMESMKEN